MEALKMKLERIPLGNLATNWCKKKARVHILRSTIRIRRLFEMLAGNSSSSALLAAKFHGNRSASNEAGFTIKGFSQCGS